MTFSNLNLCDELLVGIDKLGFETPTPVQGEVIPFLLKEKTDLVALAQTGTGKTGAFGLPILQRLDRTNPRTQALILCPTRELCMQIARDLESYAFNIPGITILPVYGGTDIRPQLHALDNGVQIIVATPGRLLDLIAGDKTDFNSVKHVVLDEADEMLNMGFEEEMTAILSEVPDTAQTLLFSATMPREVSRIASKYMKTPHEITIGSRNTATEQVCHEAMLIHAKDRYNGLRRLVDSTPDIYGIVFCRTRVETQMIADRLNKDGYSAEALHGDMYQEERDIVMNKFRDHRLQLLVATDVAARGLDISDLTNVIHYALPDDINTYTHRSGRTGRAGRTGTSTLIYHQREHYKIERIEKKLNQELKQRAIPTGDEISRVRLNHLAGQINSVEIDEELIAPHFEEMKSLLDELSTDELIKRVVLLLQRNALQHYHNTPDLSTEPEKQRTKSNTATGISGKEARDAHVPREMTKGMIELVINVGQRNELTESDLKELLNNASAGRSIKVGRINIVQMQCYFEVPYNDSMNLISQFKKNPAEFDGRMLNVALAGNARPAGTSARSPKRKSQYEKRNDRKQSSSKPRSESKKSSKKPQGKNGQFKRKKRS